MGVLFLRSSQPIIIVMRLIFVSLVYSFIIYEGIGTFWYSYILLLVILRGVLVVFTYIASLVPNEMFEINYFIVIVTVVVLLMGRYWGGVMKHDWRVVILEIWMYGISFFNLFIVGFLLGVIVIVVWMTFSIKISIRGVYLVGAWLKGLVW